MAGSLSQVSVENSNSDDNFIQIRFPEGETPSGTIYLYDNTSTGNPVQVNVIDTINVADGTLAFTVDGFDYYNFDANGVTSGTGNDVAAVAYEDGSTLEVLAFASANDNKIQNAEFNGGPLDNLKGSAVEDIAIGNQFYTDPGANQGFTIGPPPNQTVTTGSNNPDQPCFVTGTMILTPNGEVAVETLKAGDAILTAKGTVTAVKWIGIKDIITHEVHAEHQLPVRITAGALAPSVPNADLELSADHAVMIDGVLVQAGALVNGTSVVRTTRADFGGKVTYYHIETDNHDIIVANGTDAETYLDGVTRRMFDNYAEYEALFGDDGRDGIAELPQARVMSRRQLPAALRERIEERAEALMPAAEARAA